MVAQRRQLESAFGVPVQRQEDEELMQGKLEPAQRQEDEELMQGKFDPAQRQEDEELMQGKFDPAQRQEDEELLQGKFSEKGTPVQLKGDPGQQENRTGMPDHLKTGIETLSGMDMSHVRVHYGSARPPRVNALAYTQGNDIHLAPGQERHLPHEAWHVVQQMQGRVQPTTQAEGVPINDDQGLETEADVQGARAVQMREPSNQEPKSVPHERRSTYQRMAVMAATDMDKQKDTLVWNNLDYAVEKAGGPVGDLSAHMVWSQLKDNEEVRIVEHGAVGSVGGYSAETIRESMQRGNLPKGTIRRIAKVVFQSCYSAMPGGAGSLVSDMQDELKQVDQDNVPVEGRAGIAFGFKGMGEEVAKTTTGTYTWTNPKAEAYYIKHLGLGGVHGAEEGRKAYIDAMYTLRKERTKDTKRKIFKKPFVYNDPWKIIKLSKRKWNQLSEADKRTKISEQMEPYWKKLATTMGGGTYKGFA
jgi:hypothetical protein